MNLINHKYIIKNEILTFIRSRLLINFFKKNKKIKK